VTKKPRRVGEAKLALNRKGRKDQSVSVAHHTGTEALAVRRPPAGSVDHVAVGEWLDRGRHLAGGVDNCAVTERPNHRRPVVKSVRRERTAVDP
jgi:hypothetical protein